MSRLREPLKGRGFGQNRRATAFSQLPGSGGTDGHGRSRGQQPVEILFAQRTLELYDRGGACERDGADAIAPDPGPALLQVE